MQNDYRTTVQCVIFLCCGQRPILVAVFYACETDYVVPSVITCVCVRVRLFYDRFFKIYIQRRRGHQCEPACRAVFRFPPAGFAFSLSLSSFRVFLSLFFSPEFRERKQDMPFRGFCVLSALGRSFVSVPRNERWKFLIYLSTSI